MECGTCLSFRKWLEAEIVIWRGLSSRGYLTETGLGHLEALEVALVQLKKRAAQQDEKNK